MHDHTYPESEEPADTVEARATAALQYEEKAKLGFRRRLASGAGDPFANPDEFTVGSEQSLGVTWGSYFAAISVVAGGMSVAYKPLMLGTIALFAGIIGTIGGGRSVRTARLGLIIACIGFTIGMLFAISFDKPVF